MVMKSSALLVLAAIIAAAAGQRPSPPVINSEQRVFSIIEVDLSATAYNDLVTKKDSANVLITWTVATGGIANWARVFCNGLVCWSGASSATGSASYSVSRGGRYETIVQVCNSFGCSHSEFIEIIVADTDGSHLSPLEYAIEENHVPFEQTSGKIVGTYFMEWGVYGRNYPLNRVPISNLNYILYAFIPICGGEGINDSLEDSSFQALQNACAGREDFKVAIHDPWAALQVSQQGVNTSSDPYRGNFGQLMMLKQLKPDFKIIPSIGGWTLSDPFYFFDDAVKRKTFIDSVKDFLETWKFFDGVDIDWEFPGGNGANPNLGNPDVDGDTYIALMKELREMLDELSAETGRKYELTSAISAGWEKIKMVDYGIAQKYMDHIFLMTYDFYVGSVIDVLGHQTALYAPAWNSSEVFTADHAVKLLVEQGVPTEKLVLGCAMYGRGWTGVYNYTDGIPFTGQAIGPVAGTWEDGVVDYRVIPEGISAGSYDYYFDDVAVAAYVFNNETGDLISFDDTKSATLKGEYVVEHNLAGLFSWQIQADNGDVLNGMNIGVGNTPVAAN
uniref:Chitinase-h n=1 Tax=Glyphodes pyloalis TaxID=1242752 RepID=A0A6G7S6Y6_GLYPY|nr:chitinase-h [Glyphodes pyloalis]